MEKAVLPAVKASIGCLLGGKPLKGEGGSVQGLVIDMLGRKVSRAIMIATAIDKFASADGNYMAITMDDGSGILRAKFFGDDARKNSGVRPGDELLFIGRVKQYNGETYISPETVRQVRDFNYTSFRRLEMLKDMVRFKRLAGDIRSVAEKDGMEAAKRYAVEGLGIPEEALDIVLSCPETKKADPEKVVAGIIKNLDDGTGVGLETILKESGLSESQIDAAVTKLLDDGAVFEPHVGKFKAIG